MEDIIKQALKMVEPSKEERAKVDEVAEVAIDLVKEEAKRYDEVREVTFGGSYAKDTWISNDVDVDIFVKIDPSIDDDRFEYIGKDLGLKALKDYNPYLKYAQHPYVEAMIDGIRINIVPCYDVPLGSWKSAADRSIYHTQYMKDRLDDDKRKEVRLLKRFMKGIKVYGAEIAVNGFSGYVCEVLILKYDTFLNVLNNAKSFKERQVISIDKVDKSILDLFDTPIIIIDPIDSKRNLGAAISSKSLARLILAARSFLANPSLDYFKELALPKNYGLLDNIIVLTFNYKQRSEDIIWGQAKSSLNAIIKHLAINDFKVIRGACNIDLSSRRVAYALLFESVERARYAIKQGPKVFNKEHADRFIDANKGSSLLWIEGSRLKALVKRDIIHADKFIEFILKERIDGIGISKGLVDDIRKGFSIYNGKIPLNDKLVKSVIDEVEEYDGLL